MERNDIGLYRGRETASREWRDGDLFHNHDGRVFVGELVVNDDTDPRTLSTYELGIAFAEVDPETVGQFTGLTDKAGRKAFEHDIIKHHFGDEIGVIRYGSYRNPFSDDAHGGHTGFHIDWVAGSCPECLRKDLGYWMQVTEIIGNIHDNPELLEVCHGEE